CKMNPTDNIEKFIKNSTLNTNPQMDESVLNEILTAQEKSTSVGNQPSIWRIIMKNRITKFTAAAVIIIAVIMVLYSFNGSVGITTSAFASELAQVQKNMHNKSWIHGKYEYTQEGELCSYEYWESFDRTWCASKYSNGPIAIIDWKNKKNITYYPDSNTIKISPSNPLIINGNKPITEPADLLDDLLEPLAQTGGKITRQRGKHNGQDVDIYQIERSNDYNNTIRKGNLYVDIQRRLPIGIDIVEVDSEGQITITINGSFDFPKTGPQTIYDLGAPKSAKIIEHKIEIK
ncbi:hypothetical protein ACFL02_09205, partial [Planctomycetota bacterium]